jgi:amidophosphoribosyltransferase
MCGIVGLYLKDPDLRGQLGSMFAPMLTEMTDRGPDSAGFAVFRDSGNGASKICAYDPSHTHDWQQIAASMSLDLGQTVTADRCASHVLLHAASDTTRLQAALTTHAPNVGVMSAGTTLEIFKEIGLPADVMDRFGVPQMAGSHMIGHTRMATESAVTTEGAHPFSTGQDLCLVHNGSLSNHNVLKRKLQRDAGLTFQTENDSEVAAGYLTWQMQQGASLHEALEAAIRDLDGFYTFTVGTKDGFAVLRDPIACKPAIMAETDQWVVMASEFRALARLPGIEKATLWEPKPATVYSWGHA